MKINEQYMVMDRTAIDDVLSAGIIDCFESENEQTARKYYKENYDGQDSLLVDANCKIIW